MNKLNLMSPAQHYWAETLSPQAPLSPLVACLSSLATAPVAQPSRSMNSPIWTSPKHGPCRRNGTPNILSVDVQMGDEAQAIGARL